MESPLTVEESITLLNCVLCIPVQDVVSLPPIQFNNVLSIESLGFTVRRGQTGPQINYHKAFLRADTDSLQPVKPITLYHSRSRSCPNLASLKAVAEMKYDPLEKGTICYFKYGSSFLKWLAKLKAKH